MVRKQKTECLLCSQWVGQPCCGVLTWKWGTVATRHSCHMICTHFRVLHVIGPIDFTIAMHSRDVFGVHVTLGTSCHLDPVFVNWILSVLHRKASVFVVVCYFLSSWSSFRELDSVCSSQEGTCLCCGLLLPVILIQFSWIGFCLFFTGRHLSLLWFVTSCHLDPVFVNWILSVLHRKAPVFVVVCYFLSDHNVRKQRRSYRTADFLNTHLLQDLLCGPSFWLQIQRSGFDSRRYQIFWEVVSMERGPLSLVSTIEELLGRKNSGSGLESREYGRRDPWRTSHTLSENLALTSPTSGVDTYICT
jgi:hypothetical protein